MAESGKKLSGANSNGSAFRYYIHDGVEEFRLQLIGTLLESRVPELTGCWSTARSTLSSRQLILDLSALRSSDEAGREWLLSMVREGAVTLPDNYFRVHLLSAGVESECGAAKPQRGFWGRFMGFGRSNRELPVESSSRAR